MNTCADVDGGSDRIPEEDWVAEDVTDLDSSTFAVAPDLDVAHYLTKAEYLSKQQAGEYVGLHPKTIEREIQRGRLTAYKLAGKVRIKLEDLEAWIAAGKIDPSIHSI